MGQKPLTFSRTITLNLFLLVLASCEVIDPLSQTEQNSEQRKEVTEATFTVSSTSSKKVFLNPPFGEGASIEFSENSFSSNAQIKVQKGVELISSYSFQDTSSIVSVNYPIRLENLSVENPLKPIKIVIPVDSDVFSLSEYSVLYQRIDYETEEIFRGKLSSEKFSLENGLITIQADYFGVYQVVVGEDGNLANKEFQTTFGFQSVLDYESKKSETFSVLALTTGVYFQGYSMLLEMDSVVDTQITLEKDLPASCELHLFKIGELTPSKVLSMGITDFKGHPVEYQFTFKSEDRAAFQKLLNSEETEKEPPLLSVACINSAGQISYSNTDSGYNEEAKYYNALLANPEVSLCSDGSLPLALYRDMDGDGFGQEKVDVCPGDSVAGLVSNSSDENDIDFDNDGIPTSLDPDDATYNSAYNNAIVDIDGFIAIGNAFMWKSFTDQCSSVSAVSCGDNIRLYGNIYLSDLNYTPGNVESRDGIYKLNTASNASHADFMIGSAVNPYTGFFDGNGKTVSNFKFIFGNCSAGFELTPKECAQNGDNWSGVNQVGLFGTVDGGKITRLNVDGILIGNQSVGGIVGKAIETELSYNLFIGEVFAEVNAGLVAGEVTSVAVSSKILANTGKGSVFSGNYLGGLVGRSIGALSNEVVFTGNSVKGQLLGYDTSFAGGISAHCNYCIADKNVVNVSYSTNNANKADVYFYTAANTTLTNSYYVLGSGMESSFVIPTSISQAQYLSSSIYNSLDFTGLCKEDNSITNAEDCFVAGYFWDKWEIDDSHGMPRMLQP